MAELIAAATTPTTRREADRAELLARLGWARLPDRLTDLGPLERGLLLLALQESTEEEYPTELLESLTTIDDCLYYMTVKRGRA